MTSDQEREYKLLLKLVQAHYDDDEQGFTDVCRELAGLYDDIGRHELAEWLVREVS